MRKLCARWVPRLLTIAKHTFVTMDETWIHYYTPQSREGLKQWVKPGEIPLKRSETQQSAGKIMVSIFGMHME